MRLGLRRTSFTLSSGRAVLGIGAAWNKEEAQGLGLSFPSRSERYEMLEEVLRIARRMGTVSASPPNDSRRW
ncbi:hypothetical protein [Catenulispora subtropica]|uniref:Uncharacterized protein n=1 Tax=Catenulispora subtropica TaxID=450798 RepID=A0ABP5DVZ5_9ACTN